MINRTTIRYAAAVSLLLALPSLAAGPGEPAATQPDDTTLRVVTLNALGAKMASAEKIAEVVGRHRPDVVLLQEVSPALAGRIAAAMKLHVATPPVGPRSSWPETAILSRSPLTDVRALHRDGERIFGVAADAKLAGRPTTLVAIHLWSTHPGPLAQMHQQTAQRLGETDHLLAELGKIDGPIVMGGDFNEGYKSPSLKRLGKRFGHAFDKAGHGDAVTFPAFASGIQIDHIFYTHHFDAADSFVDPTRISDHRMVVATLKWAPPASQPDEGLPSARQEKGK